MNKNLKLLCMAAGLTLLFGSNVLAAENDYYFGAGNGTKESPYWVENIEHLQNIGLFPNAYYIQTKDIDAGDKAFMPIGSFDKPFSGHYDGEGHKITINDLGAINGDIKLAGVWGFTSEAEIKNLNVEINASLNLDGRVCLGGIVACSNKTNISGCSLSSDSNIYVNSEKCLYAGGIIGYSAFGTVIRNCSFEGRLEGRSRGDIDAVCAVGGIVGENRTGARIKKSTFAETASVSGNSAIAPAWVGGIAGFNENSTYVCDCHAVVPMNLKPEYGDQKQVFTKISKCNSAGTVSGYSLERISVGGICGFNAADVANCISQSSSNTRGSIVKCNDVPSALIGGVVGDNNGTVYNSSSISSIQMLSDGFLGVGGIVGRNAGIINRCNYYAISGKALSSFTALRSFNLISAIESVSARGGIAGINDNSTKKASITDCKVFGTTDEQAITSYGHTRGSYGKYVGLETNP